MALYTLQITALGSFSGGNAPLLEVLVDGVVFDSRSMTGGASPYSFNFDFTGSFPSSISFRFSGTSGDPGDTITISSATVNGSNIFGGNNANNVNALLLQRGDESFDISGRFVPDQTDLGADDGSGTGGDDNLVADGTDNVVDLGLGDDRIYADSGDDAINGGDGNDRIFGGGGGDIIIGGAGDDRIWGQDGNDQLYGEDGVDRIIGGDGDDIINGGAGNDFLIGDAGADTIFGEDGDDRLIGKDGNDVLFGDAGEDILNGGNDDDIIFGGDDDDRLIGGGGDDMLDGGAGNDQIIGNDGIDTIDGEAGNDEIYGGAGADVIGGQDGTDTIYGEDGNDVVTGGNGDDFIIGGAGADTIDGGADNDVLHGHGVDTVTISSILRANPNVVYSAATGSFYEFVDSATSWNDARTDATTSTLNGITGHLVNITSAAENEFIYQLGLTNGADNSIGASGNRIWLGANDLVTDQEWFWIDGPEGGLQFSNAGTSVNGFYENWGGGQPNNSGGAQVYATMWFNGGGNDDTWDDRNASDNHDYVIEWESGLMSDDNAIDTISGGEGNDTIYGYGGDDILNGDNGNDTLFGGDGNDQLGGGGGADLILGGDGDDDISGGNVGDFLYGENGDDIIGGGNGGDTIDGGADDDTIDGGNGNDDIAGGTGSDTIDGGANDDVIYALNSAVNINSVGATVSTMVTTSPVTLFNTDFNGTAAGFSYADGGNNGTDPRGGGLGGGAATAQYLGSDGDAGNGSLEIDITGVDGSTETNISATLSRNVTIANDVINAQIEFSYRLIHDGQHEGNEDFGFYFAVDGVQYDTGGGSGIVAIVDDGVDTDWVSVTIDIGDLDAGTYTLSWEAYKNQHTQAAETSDFRLDDIDFTADEITSSSTTQIAGNTTTDADSGESNIINGDDGDDTIYGSSGNDILNGDDGSDTIYAGTVDAQTALLNTILAANPSVSYNHDTGNFYQWVDFGANINWNAANTAATSATLNSVSGHMATITSAAEQSFLEGLAGGNNTWLGGSDTGTEGVWTWNTGTGYESGAQFGNAGGASVNGWYENWAGGQPNDSDGAQDYLYMLNGAQWADGFVIGGSGFVDIEAYMIEWEGADVFAALNTNTLNGGDGLDTLYGSDGIDIFVFDNLNNTDVIENFNIYGRDKIDIGDIISYDPLTDDISDFVELNESGGNTTLRVDADGAGGFTNVAQINGVTGLNLDELITGDNLLVV